MTFSYWVVVVGVLFSALIVDAVLKLVVKEISNIPFIIIPSIYKEDMQIFHLDIFNPVKRIFDSSRAKWKTNLKR